MTFFSRPFIKVLLGIAALGFVVSHPSLLGWLGSQPPWYAFAIWYVVFFAFIFYLGITLLPGKFQLNHAIGLLILWFALSPILGWLDNPELSQRLTGARLTGVEAGPEETLITYFWQIFTNDIGALILLVYVITPVVLTMIAFAVMRRQFFEALHRLVV